MAAIPDTSGLSLPERIGQTLCFGWQGETVAESRAVTPHARELVEAMRIGGLVLMGRNVNAGDPDAIRTLIAALQDLSPVPLFIATDQEGGIVNRLRAPFHEFPGNMALGATGHAEFVYQQAQTQARELRAVGINWNFAPCVDVNCNPDNPIIGVRSYGEDPALVARMGAAAVRGYQETGMLACAKHFPGHGDTAVDSHLSQPTVRGDRARLDTVELAPFRAAIAEGVGAVMTSHVLFPALDASQPSTLAPAVLTGLLRREMGFDGLVVTDCLEMKAIADTLGTPRGAVEALKAGADMVLVCHTRETQRATVAAITEAVRSGDLPEQRLNEAAGRVLAAKRRFLTTPLPVEEAPWRDPANDALEREIARASITVVRNNDAMPLNILAGDRLWVLSCHTAGRYVAGRLKKHARRWSNRSTPSRPVPWIKDETIHTVKLDLPPGATYHLTHASYPLAQVHRFLEQVNATEKVLFVSFSAMPWKEDQVSLKHQAEIVHHLHTYLGNRLIVVAAREPYDLRCFTEVENYICCYSHLKCSLDALAEMLFGVFEPTGRLPVTVPGSEPVG